MIVKILDQEEVEQRIADGSLLDFIKETRPHITIRQVKWLANITDCRLAERVNIARGNVTGYRYGDRLAHELWSSRYHLKIGDTWFIVEMENPTIDDLFPKEDVRMICSASEMLKASKMDRLGMFLRQLFVNVNCNEKACLALGHKYFWRTGGGKISVYAMENGVAVLKRTFDSRGWNYATKTNVTYFTRCLIEGQKCP